MNNIKNKALKNLQAGLSVIPTNEDKTPAIKSWKKYQTELLKEDDIDNLFNSPGLAIVCGAVSNNLEIIDVDTKHDNSGRLWEDFIGLIEDNIPDVYNSLVISKTKSGGFHIYYRCTEIAGNLKLAINENKEVLLETRGEGGYIIAPPSPGYEYIKGNPLNIPKITPKDREILFGIAKSFNEIIDSKELKHPSREYNNPTDSLSPFEDYNQRGDILGLLENSGWKIVNQRGDNINLLRPGDTNSKTSGGFHITKRVLNIFSSSTIFEPGKGYNPSTVFTFLECNGDKKDAYKKLLQLGYGQPFKIIPLPLRTEKIKVISVNKITGVNKVISNPGETLTYDKIIIHKGAEITITSSNNTTEEILKALELIDETNIRVYVKEGNKPEVRGFIYKLRTIIEKYEKDVHTSNVRKIDNLLDEIVTTAYKLQPIDRDIFLNNFQENIGKTIGVNQETIKTTVENLTVTWEKEQKNKAFKKMLSEIIKLEDKGEIDTAIDYIENNIKEVKLKDKKTEFNKLLIPNSEKLIKETEENLPGSLKTDYTIKGEDLLLPGGAISVIAAPTNHGKTAFLNNLVLNVSKKYKDKEFIFFTYEENSSSIIQYLLNIYINTDLNNSKTSNRRILKDYFKTGSTQFINKERLNFFEIKKTEFFKTYIESGRIRVYYIDYDSQELIDSISFLYKENKNLGGIFIDYFQLINAPGKIKRDERINTRQEELKYICQRLKNIAVKTGLPLCLAAQFNREVTDLTKLHPTNIGEAGDIERIVNTLVGLWNLDKKPSNSNISKGDTKEIEDRIGNFTTGMYVEILKSRDLPTGAYEIFDFIGNTGNISNIKTNSPF